MAKRKPTRAKAAKAAAKRSTRARAAGSRTSAAKRPRQAAKKTGAKKSVKRTSARKATRKVAKKAAKQVTRQRVARKAAAAKSVKRAAKAGKKAATRARTIVRKVAKKAAKAPALMKSVAATPRPPLAAAPATVNAPRPKRAPTLDRARKTVDTEPHDIPSSLDLDRPPSAARSGRKELAERLKQHTSTGPAITAGDVDADWEDAESTGDEAPGGDNPTPDQDVVDEIGRALGVEYDDDEELKGGDEIATRDKHRWELDPASSDDFKDRD